MPNEIAGVAVVLLIIGLVEAAKGHGLNSRWAPIAAMGIGLVIFALNQLANIYPVGRDWYNVLLWGMASGLMAVGLYSGSKNVV
jgi:hypothetical protein